MSDVCFCAADGTGQRLFVELVSAAEAFHFGLVFGCNTAGRYFQNADVRSVPLLSLQNGTCGSFYGVRTHFAAQIGVFRLHDGQVVDEGIHAVVGRVGGAFQNDGSGAFADEPAFGGNIPAHRNRSGMQGIQGLSAEYAFQASAQVDGAQNHRVHFPGCQQVAGNFEGFVNRVFVG